MDKNNKQVVIINYTNWKNETEDRNIIPIKIWYGKTEWHPLEQWLLKAFDIDKQSERDFSMLDIHSWSPLK